MSFYEYISARESLITIGSPVITSILMISLAQGVLSLGYLWKKDDKYYNILTKLLRILAILYMLGFVLLIRFHVQIYEYIIIKYPVFMRHLIPIENSHLIIPLWIENEKLFFWAMLVLLFTSSLRNREVVSFLGVMLSIFSAIIFFFSNPFRDPLPTLHREITNWHVAFALKDMSIFKTAIMLYERITYYYNSVYMWSHPPMLFIAYASLVITFAACVFMLVKRDKVYDEIAYRYAKIGYIFLTFGMLMGYPWAVEAWKNQAWWWDPKISGSIMMWLLYTAYLHAHIYIKKMWNATAYMGIICFASLVFTYLLTYIMPGIHSVVT